MNPGDQECLVRDVKAESKYLGDWKIQFELDITSAMALVGNLQLALRHPLNDGPSSIVARQLIDDLRQGLLGRNLKAHAKMIELGDDPDYDYSPMPGRNGLALVRKEEPQRAGTSDQRETDETEETK